MDANEGECCGEVYERGNTNGTNIANKGAYYVRVIYILYKVRVYVYAKPGVKPIVAPSTVAEVLVKVVDGHHAHAAWQAAVQFLANAAFKHLHNVGDGWIVGHGFLWMTRVFLRCSQEFPQCSRVFRRAPRKILRRAAV